MSGVFQYVNMDIIREIWASLRQNKFRTCMTGFAVAWGIFIFIVLLAANTGIKNGIMGNFGTRSLNMVNIWAGRTSMPYMGWQANRRLYFTDEEAMLVRNMPEVDKFSRYDEHWGINMAYGSETTTGTFRGVEPEYREIYGLKVLKGRFINPSDLYVMKKVVVIDERMAEKLFKNRPDVLGQYIKINSLLFQVVGVVSKGSAWEGATVYAPFPISMAIFRSDLRFSDMAFTLKGLGTKEANEAFEEQLRARLGQVMQFDRNDRRAVGVWNTLESYMETQTIMRALTVFIMLIGISTLMSGAVGVSNIMLVSVKERTREIGIRKAIGASPRNIIFNIIGEALVITLAFGYIGMMAGIGLVELINNSMNIGNEQGASIFKDPTVELPYVFLATVILVIAGVVSGYMPARKAVKIKSIEAMMADK